MNGSGAQHQHTTPLPPHTGTVQRHQVQGAGREHESFVANLPVSGADLQAAVIAAWQPTGEMTDWPQERVQQLVAAKYGQPEWNFRN